MRRLILIAGLWLGLLGVVQPLLACAMNPSMLNCCPDGMQTPCNSGSDQPGTSLQSAECCATAPATIAVAVAVDSRDAHLAQVTGGHPAGGLIAASIDWPLPVVDNLSFASRTPLHHPASGGTETYLRTGRLRL